MSGKNRSIIIPLLLICLIIISFSSILTLPESCNANGATLDVTIMTPDNGAEIPYCSNFTVSANVTSPDTIYDLNVEIVITGNASLVHGDTDGTPNTYNYSMI